MSKQKTSHSAKKAFSCLKAGFIATLNFSKLATYAQFTGDGIPLTPTLAISGSTSSDLVGSAEQTYIKHPRTPEDLLYLTDHVFSTYSRFYKPYPSTDPFEKCWWLRWAQPVQIRSFSAQLGPNGNHIDVYVTSTFPFSVGDSRLLCKSNVWPDGAFNCGHTLTGTYFVMQILDTVNEGDFDMYELRVFSTKDFAASASVVNNVQNIVGPTLPKRTDRFKSAEKVPFYIDLGAEYPISLIWVLFGNDAVQINVSIGTSLWVNSPIAYQNSWQRMPTKNNEEWNMKITDDISVRYILFCRSTMDCSGDTIEIRKVQVFARQTCVTNEISVTQTSVYAKIAWTGVLTSITWPTFIISPEDCFGIADIQFTDSNGSDLIAAGLFLVDWVTKTITYNSSSGCVSNVTMYTTFNTPEPFKDSGTNLLFDCQAYLCSISTIKEQLFGSPQAYQIIFSLPNEIALLEFPMNDDLEGSSHSDPIRCGYKTFITDKTWLQVSAISESDLQNFKLIANTNDLTLVGEQSVIITIGFQNPLYKNTLTQTLTVVVLHPCKKTIITSTQVILDMAYTFGSLALIRPFSAFEDSEASAYSLTGLCQLTYSLSTAADAERFGVTIETNPSLQIKVHALDPTLLGKNVSLTLSATATPQNETLSTQLTFIVSIQDPCPGAVIISTTTTIVDMNYTVTKSAVEQQFNLFTDSVSTATNIPGLCGPINYQISEGYQFVQLVITAIGTIAVQTNQIQDAKTYIATLSAELSRYPFVTHSKVQFNVTITNPCLSTTLVLSTILQPVLISSPGGTENLQTFAPATDQASSEASKLSLCGPKIYSIAETEPTRFVSIVPPAADLDSYSAVWSLKCFSNNSADFGIWTVTLRAQLQHYLDVPAATSTFEVKVLDICLQAVIQPEQLMDMTIYISDTSPRFQTFLPFKDRFNNILSSTGKCGPKKYSISDPLTQIFPPLSNLVDTDPWTISARTTDTNLVGVRTVILAASFLNYSALTAVTASFKLTVVDVCLNAKISNKDQVLQTMTYVPVIASLPTVQTFLPFTHDQVFQNGDPKICGPFSYSIVQGYSFIQINNPAGDPYSQKWVLSLKTTRMTDIGSYQATLQASFANYPGSVPAVLEFMIQITNPCTQTKLTSKALQAMSYKIGTAFATTQSFEQIQDDIATSIGQAKFCGERTYKLIGDLPFLKFTEPSDPWTENFKLDLQTNDKSRVGNYTATLEVNLVSFALQVPLTMRMSLYILPNKLPHFEPQLVSVISIEKTETPKTWSFQLPQIVDLDPADIVRLTVEFGSAKFLTLNGVSSIQCADISMSSNVKAGIYLIKLTLDDGRDKVDFQVSMFVYDLKEELVKDEATIATDKAQPSISENQSAKNETESSEIKQQYSFDNYVPPVPKNVLKGNVIAPKATLESISDTGLALIKFSKPMIVPTFLQDIPRRVKEATYFDYTEKVIKVEVLPGVLEDFDKLRIGNFTIQKFSELDLLVQVNFESPAYISLSAIQPDELMISFVSREYFVDAIDFLQVEQRQLKRILTQQQSQAQAAQIKALESVASKSMTVVTTGNIVLNIVLSYGLKYLWNMVNLLQFLVFIQQWKFSLPQNAGGFLKYLKSLALMEFVDTAPATKWISDKLGLCRQCKVEREKQKMLSQLKATNTTVTTARRQLEDVDLSPKLKEEAKSEDGNIIQNLGMIVIVVLAIFFVLFVLFSMKFVVYYQYSWFKHYANLKRKIFYNTFIRFFLQSALKTQIAFCITLMADGWSNWSGKQTILQKLVAATGLVVFSLIPAVFFYILRRKRTELWRPSVKAQIGSLYLGINSGSAWALSYSIVFMLRRTLFVFLMFSLMKQPAIQMNLLIYSSIFYIIYLQYVRPYDDQSSVLIETINEVILLVICYHFILLTDLLSDPFVKFKIGLSLIICVCSMIALNLSIIVFVSLRQLYCDFRKKRALRLRAQQQFQKKAVPDVNFKQLEQMAVIEEQNEEDEKSEQNQVQIDGEEAEGEQEESEEYKEEVEDIQEVLKRNRAAWENRDISSPDQSFHSDGVYGPIGMNQVSLEDDLSIKTIQKTKIEVLSFPNGVTQSYYEDFCIFHPQLQEAPQTQLGRQDALKDDATSGSNRWIIPEKRLSQSLDLILSAVQPGGPSIEQQESTDIGIYQEVLA